MELLSLIEGKLKSQNTKNSMCEITLVITTLSLHFAANKTKVFIAQQLVGNLTVIKSGMFSIQINNK